RGALEPPPPPTAQAQSLSVHVHRILFVHNQQLFLSPASLQLAQLQAQLTLHRIKLAQGGNTAASALNQVLSNVAMSHPLFNQLRTSTLIGNPQGGLPTGMLGFPSSNSQLGALVGGGLNQNPANVRLNHPAGGAQQEYGKKSGPAYLSDTDRRLQFNTSAASASCDGQYSVINTLAKNMNNASFQKDFYGHDMLGQQADFSVNEQNMNPYNPSGHKEQWKGPPNLSHSGKVDMVSNATNVWTAAGQPIRSRTELYNPEEPTPDPKFNPTGGVSSFGSSSTQGFGGYQPMHGSEETLSSGARALQPYQVNDFHAVTPSQLPHQCSICDKKVYNLKDWNHHVKGKLHLQNRTTRCSKEPFPPRKATAGRVVHICNLPEGSCTENDVINLGLPFGKVTNYILMRSTHQAFLEMAYVDAAQAMVQYYQLTPAMISNQKLLIRMSKRYKELQLKKPGKDSEMYISMLTQQCSVSCFGFMLVLKGDICWIKKSVKVMCFIYPLVCCGTGLPLLFSQVKEWGSGDDTDEECWYPNNMEELVTVDEVGGEDDSIVEPDLPELEKFESCVKEEAVVELTSSPASSSLELQEASVEKPEQEHTWEVLTAANPEEDLRLSPAAREPTLNNLSDFPTEDFKAALEETCLEDNESKRWPSEETMENHGHVSKDINSVEGGEVTETITNTVQLKDDSLKKGTFKRESLLRSCCCVCRPIGVEFIVPRSGFFCKLCGFFYTSEDTAKTSHCRSTVHYRNLQKYLSQLAEVSLSGALADPSAAQ
uniref:RNA binding motif protein 20 n=1 Tax=Labrus bergylta TaxID=56723 RepID=A0A3Q3GT06_9LABR